MDKLHAQYDPVLGRGIVDLLERLQLFQVFSSVWFFVLLVTLLVSIVVCTLDRLPRLWRQCRQVRVVQPDPFYDPDLPHRAVVVGLVPETVEAALRRRRFRVRTMALEGGHYLYGDRFQYSALATLLTHLGLVAFLAAGAVTARWGAEVGLVVADGQATTVQPIGTPDLLMVKNYGFAAPGLTTGHPMDFTTDLAVYADGRQIARKIVRVNDPLSVAGWTFHENGFGPAPDLVIRDPSGAVLWSGPVPLTRSTEGFPYDTFAVPGTDLGLQLVYRPADGILLVLPYRVTGTTADGRPVVDDLLPLAIAPGETQSNPSITVSIQYRRPANYVIVVAKKDPGQGLVWLGFASLISGIVGTFAFPRRRVWARVAPDGTTHLVWRGDPGVDDNREFAALLDLLVPASVAPDP